MLKSVLDRESGYFDVNLALRLSTLNHCRAYESLNELNEPRIAA